MVPLGSDTSRHTTLGLLTKAKRFIKVSHLKDCKTNLNSKKFLTLSEEFVILFPLYIKKVHNSQKGIPRLDKDFKHSLEHFRSRISFTLI